MTLSLSAPLALLLLPLPLLVWFLTPPHRHRTRATRVPFFRDLTQAAGVEARRGALVLRRSTLQMLAAALTWGLLVLALAGPERLGEPIVTETAARDTVLALDISGSMDTRDFAAADGTRQQRLAAVKDVLRPFIAERDGDRMALIIFGTRAFVQAPFTDDLQSLNGFLDQTEVGMAGPNTALGDSIGLAIRTFQGSEIEDRLMILLSDGSDTASTMTPINAANIAANEGVTIYTIGVGDPNATGEARVDLGLLEDIAKRTSGEFFYADDQEALTSIYQRIDELNPRTVETSTYRPKTSLAHYPLALALLIVLLTTTVLHLGSVRRGTRHV